MAHIPPEIAHVVQDYVQHVAQDVHISSAVLFGSYAKGCWRDDSDIDIAIFSEDFATMDRVEAIALLLDKALSYRFDIQPLAYDAADLLNKEENPFLHEILTSGIKVA